VALFTPSAATLVGGQRVNQAATRIGLGASVNPVPDGDSVDYTATVSSVAPGAATPAGFVQFKFGNANLGAPVALVNGQATSQAVSGATYGDHPVTAAYIPDGSGDYTASAGALPGGSIFQSSTTTTLGASDTSPYYGQAVALTATVETEPGAATPTGWVMFYSDGKALGLASLSGGVAELSKATPVGGHTITATYLGTKPDSGSTSGGVGVAVSPALTGTSTVSITAGGSAVSDVTYGTPVTLSATVTNTVSSPVPVGAVLFYDDSVTPMKLIGGAVLSAGTATLTTSQLSGSNTHTIIGVYSGTPNLATSTSAAVASLQVDPAHTSTSLSTSTGSAICGQKVTFTATVTNTATSAAPTGLVSFYNGSTLIGGAAVGAGGVATLTRTILTAGSYSVTASYAGTSNFAASGSSASSLTVAQAAAAVVLSPVPATSPYGTPVSFTATVSSPYAGAAITGFVQFYDGTKNLGAPVAVSGGVATLSLAGTVLIAGPHTISAKYLGSTVFLASAPTAGQTVTVNPATTAVIASSAPTTGGVVFSGTVQINDSAAVPVGTIQILNGTTVLATVVPLRI
jgi:hypothetical protein